MNIEVSIKNTSSFPAINTVFTIFVKDQEVFTKNAGFISPSSDHKFTSNRNVLFPSIHYERDELVNVIIKASYINVYNSLFKSASYFECHVRLGEFSVEKVNDKIFIA